MISAETEILLFARGFPWVESRAYINLKKIPGGQPFCLHRLTKRQKKFHLPTNICIIIPRLAIARQFDAVVIESTGVSEPQQVAETFTFPIDMAEEEEEEEEPKTKKAKKEEEEEDRVKQLISF